MLNERQSKIVEVLQKTIGGEMTLDELFTDVVTGAGVYLWAMTRYFNHRQGIEDNSTQDGTLWRIVDQIMMNLEPREEMPTELKWYITHYELHSVQEWELMEMILNKLEEVGGIEAFRQLAKDPKWLNTYSEAKVLEKIINNKLKTDKLECLTAELWSESLEKYNLKNKKQ